MSFFPSTISYHQPQQTTFGPLFRLLEDFDQYSSNKNSSQQHRGTSLKTFQPKFDVQEHVDSYELHGELPGVEQKDVNIEFVDRQTLTIKGKIERSSQSSSSDSSQKQVEDATAASNKSHKATVEDEDSAAAAESKTDPDVGKKAGGEVAEKPTPTPKFWVSERTVGQFTRSFSFPDSVDQENVTASMKNGILNIIVPKAKKYESRKITIS